MTGVEGSGKVEGLLGVEGPSVEGSGVEGLGPVQAVFSPVSAVLILDPDEESTPFTLIGLGGDPPYTYAFEWVVQPDPDITFIQNGDEVTFHAALGIAPDDYAGSLRGTVTDNQGQQGIAMLSVAVTVPETLEAEWTPADITEEVEEGNDSTSAEVIVTGGITPYVITFDWVGGVAPDPDIAIVEEDDTTIHISVGAVDPDVYTGTVRASVEDDDGNTTTADLPIEIEVPEPVVGFFEVALAAMFPTQMDNRLKMDDTSGTLLANSGTIGGAGNWNITNTLMLNQAGVGLDAVDLGVIFNGVGNIASGGSHIISTSAVSGAVFMVCRLNSTQPGSTTPCPWAVGGTTVNTNRIMMQMRLSPVAGPALEMRTSATVGFRLRQWPQADLFLDDALHFFAFVQRADGTGVHLFVDGVEMAADPDLTGGVVPGVDFWGASFDIGVIQSYIGRGAQNSSPAFCSMICYHASSVVDVNVTDENIADLAATIAF